MMHEGTELDFSYALQLQIILIPQNNNYSVET